MKHNVETHRLLYRDEGDHRIVYCSEPECDFNRQTSSPKHSAIASILWQWHDEMETKANWWRNTQEDCHGIAMAMHIALQEQANALEKVLVKNYGERKPE